VTFHRYIALGDSFAEGVGDEDLSRPNAVRGWADRVAEVLAGLTPDFGYANFGIRGKKLRPIVADQFDTALAMKPDVVTIYAGANDVIRPKVDLDDLLGEYDTAMARLAAQVPTVAIFTSVDPYKEPVFGLLRGRWAIYNEGVREIADRHGLRIVDYWRMREYRDLRYWSADRMHMSTDGHALMAAEVLKVLGIDSSDARELTPNLPRLQASSSRERRASNWAWTTGHAVPWLGRRLRGISTGDGLQFRYPNYVNPLTDDMSLRS
jgi:lysophospholipase L1-like esterase